MDQYRRKCSHILNSGADPAYFAVMLYARDVV
jgi:hypothetical protein